jgi:hypothetical protein
MAYIPSGVGAFGFSLNWEKVPGGCAGAAVAGSGVVAGSVTGSAVIRLPQRRGWALLITLVTAAVLS